MKRVIAISLLLTACSPPAGGPRPLYDLASGDLFDAPWPSDGRRGDDGQPDLSGFPNPEGIALLERYLETAGTLGGFGNNSPIYLRFAGALDTTRLPSAAESVDDGSSVFLVDIDPNSPGWGERVPLQWKFTAERHTYEPGNLLAVAPVWGFPLRPSTRYGLVVTTDVADQSTPFLEDFEGAAFDALREVLDDQRVRERRVAVATVFTTADPLDEMRRMVAFVEDELTARALPSEVSFVAETSRDVRFDGQFEGPLFQFGDKPYATEGGEFRFAADGSPELAGWEPISFRLCTPTDLDNPPAEGWPVVVYQHGTGGNHRGVCNSTGSREVGSQLASVGLVTLSIDQPLHGDRATPETSEDLHSFNVLNPDSARTNFRQGAIDALYLVHLLRSQGEVSFASADGHQVPLDTSRISFMGHSQGGLTGGLALPFFDGGLGGAMLSGAGGGLAITATVRKDPLDFALLISDVLQFDDGEQVDPLHPVVGLLQWLVDSTDPLNYSPYWFYESLEGVAQVPTPVLMTSGLDDAQTSYLTAEAMAAAARLPVLAPQLTFPESFEMRAMPTEAGPLQGNTADFEGAPITAGFSQWNGTHGVALEDLDAIGMYRLFLETAAADGAPIIAVGQ